MNLKNAKKMIRKNIKNSLIFMVNILNMASILLTAPKEIF